MIAGMTAGEELHSTRPGTYADLSRRMDRQDERSDALESEVRTMGLALSRVEQNQQHQAQLAEYQFKGLDSSVKTLTSTQEAFIKRIEGIITGEVQTQQSRQGQAIVEDFIQWRKGVDARLDGFDDREERRTGVMSALSGAKGIILMICAIASPIVAAAAIIFSRPA